MSLAFAYIWELGPIKFDEFQRIENLSSIQLWVYIYISQIYYLFQSIAYKYT